MSFILDALKNLEQKRRRESVPDLTTVHFSANYEHKKRSPWPYVLAAALLLNAAILAVWLISGDSEKHEVIARSAPEGDKPAEAAVIENVPAKSTSLSKPEPVIKAVIEKPDSRTEPPQKDEKPDLQETENNTTALRMDISEKELVDLRSQIRKEQGPPADEPLPEYVHPAEKMETGNSTLSKDILELDQLPVSVREELPQIRIVSHIYSNNPRARVVNINGSVIREGESVIKGLMVEEITMNGVILGYEGYLFRMRAF